MKEFFQEAVDSFISASMIAIPLVCTILTASLHPDEKKKIIQTIQNGIEKSKSEPHIKLPDTDPFRYQI